MTEDDWKFYLEDLREQGIDEHDDADFDDINPGICNNCRYADEKDCHYYGKEKKTKHGDNRFRRWKYEGLGLANRGKKRCKHYSLFTPEEEWKSWELESFLDSLSWIDDDTDVAVGIQLPPAMLPGETYGNYYARVVGRTLDEVWAEHVAKMNLANGDVNL